MRFLPAWKYQLSGVKWPLIVYYIVIAALLTLMGISISLAEQQNTVMSVGGLEMASMVFVFVVGLNSFKQTFLMLSANSVSRKTMFVSFLALLGIMAIGMAVIDSAYELIMKAVGDYRSMYEQIYRLGGASAVSGFVWRVCSYLAAGMAGYLITTLYYRMNKPVKLLVSIGVPVLVLFVWPAMDNTLWNGATTKAASHLIAWASGFSSGNPYIGVLSDIVLAVVLGALSFIALRRAPVKAKTS